MRIIAALLFIGVPILVCIVIPMLALHHLDKHNQPPPWMW